MLSVTEGIIYSRICSFQALQMCQGWLWFINSRDTGFSSLRGSHSVRHRLLWSPHLLTSMSWRQVSWLISSLMLYAYWFDQPEVPVQYSNELKDFCCDNSMPDHICGVLLCLTAAPLQELQGKMQETHSKCSWNNLCIGKSSTLFASGIFLLRFVGVCIPSEKEYFGSYLLWMSSTSRGDAFFKFA